MHGVNLNQNKMKKLAKWKFWSFLVLGLALVVSIVGQYFARVALLYILVALAPIVLVLGILHPARWLQWLWVKGVLLVMLLGPINALLFKLGGYYNKDEGYLRNLADGSNLDCLQLKITELPRNSGLISLGII